MEIKINIDEDDIRLWAKEYFYTNGKRETKQAFEKLINDKVITYIRDMQEKEFKEIMTEAVKSLLKEYNVRDFIKLLKDEKVKF